MAIIAQSSCDVLCDITKRYWRENKELLNRCPNWVNQGLSSIANELFKNIQNNWVVWGIWEGEKFVASWADYSEKSKKKVMEKGNDLQNHYWLKQVDGYKTLKMSGNYASRNYEITKKSF